MTLGKSYLVKHLRRNISPMLAIDPSSIADDLIHAALNNPEAFRNRPKGQARR